MAEGSSFLKTVAAVGCGIIGAVFALFLGCSVLLVGASDSFQEGLREGLGDTSAPSISKPSVELMDWEWVRDGEWVEIKGQLRNISAEPIQHLSLQVSFLDDTGSLVERARFVTDPVLIGPGEIATFEYPEPWDPRMSKARVSMFLNGRSVQYRRAE